MAVFKINNEENLEIIKEKPFKLEKNIQSLTEKNLTTIFGLTFVKSEFSLKNFRIDTLAFDQEAKSFIIIEYKRNKNFSIIDQGYSYLSLMLNNKADFILEYNENFNQSLKRKEIDWSQSRVIFISQSFTNYQKAAINFKNLPITLWEVKRYNNQTVSYQQIKAAKSQESISTVGGQSEMIENVSNEVKVYTEDDHLNNKSEELKELYEKVKEGILNLEDNVVLQAKKQSIGFKIENNIFCDIVFLSKELKVYLNLKKGDVQDAKNLTRDVSSIGHWGSGDYEIRISDLEELEYILSLLKQSLRKNMD